MRRGRARSFVERALSVCIWGVSGLSMGAALPGCGAPATTQPPPVPAPIPEVTLGEPLAIAPQVLLDLPGAAAGPIGFLAGLPAEAVALTLGRELATLAAGAPAPLRLGVDAGEVHAVLPVTLAGSSTVLVGGTGGVFAVVAGVLERSPLGAALGGEPVRALLDSGAPDDPEVWIVTEAAVRLWYDGALRTVRIEPGADAAGAGGGAQLIEPARARFAVRRAPPGGHGSLIVLPRPAPFVPVDGGGGDPLAERLLIVPVADVLAGPGGGAPVTLTRVDVGRAMQEVGCDGAGAIVALSGDVLVEASAAGALSLARFPGALAGLAVDPGAPDRWLTLDGQRLLHGRAGAYQPVPIDGAALGAGAADLPALVRADQGGPLLVAGPTRVARLRAATAVAIGGVPGVVDRPVELEVAAPFPGLIRGLTADLDGAPQWTDAATRKVAIDPWSVAAGAHTLTVTVAYADGPALQATAPVTVAAGAGPSWARDVQPLFAARCQMCHGPGGSAHPMATSERWRAEIATIVAAVNERRMPLPPNAPLRGLDVATVAGWGETGFSP